MTGNAGIGHGNFFVEPGERTPQEIIASVRDGFYVTELIGMGVNVVTGDYSRGATGLWIRNGELAFAVSEVTIAGNLSKMLQDLESIGSASESLSRASTSLARRRSSTTAWIHFGHFGFRSSDPLAASRPSAR